MERLTADELCTLVQRVFAVRREDTALAFIVDLPDGVTADHPGWLNRRKMAHGWFEELSRVSEEALGIPTHLYLYGNVHLNNADLPERAWRFAGGPLPALAEDLPAGGAQSFAELFSTHSVIIAPTQFSATAPLKLAAREFGFRAATMPGFSAAMIPALRLDYAQINSRVVYLKQLLDEAQHSDIHFRVDGGSECNLRLDLRYRQAHASGGVLSEPGVAGNLPSGESYIVPYEGEVQGIPSLSVGTIPVQFADEVVFYEIAENRAVAVHGKGPAAARERELLRREPAYGNLAELGLGVLADFGVQPAGEILLDEKLGLHIAFGRSDHFGGQVGAAQFSRPEAVVHIDRVYLPETQPRVSVVSCSITFSDGRLMGIIEDDRYVVQFP